MTLNGVMAVILRYFADFVLYRAPNLGKSWYARGADGQADRRPGGDSTARCVDLTDYSVASFILQI